MAENPHVLRVLHALRCPACGARLGRAPDALSCQNCPRTFAILAGIPDLRLSYDDPYVTWDEDLARARHMQALSRELDFAQLLQEHLRHNGLPAELTRRFAVCGESSASRSRAYLGAIEERHGHALAIGEHLLEVGCGSHAGIAGAAAERGAVAIASDVSMRSLVVARRRLADTDADVTLVCCDALRPPFAEDFFDVVVAGDVIEHTVSASGFVGGCARVLRPGGSLFMATPNRFSLSLEPHVRLWGVGLLPRRLAKRYVQRVRRVPYEHVRLLSARELRRVVRERGLSVEIVAPEVPAATQESLYRGPELLAVRVYNTVRRIGWIQRVLLAVGPFFHVFARKEG